MLDSCLPFCIQHMHISTLHKQEHHLQSSANSLLLNKLHRLHFYAFRGSILLGFFFFFFLAFYSSVFTVLCLLKHLSADNIQLIEGTVVICQCFGENTEECSNCGSDGCSSPGSYSSYILIISSHKPIYIIMPVLTQKPLLMLHI